MKKLSNIKWYDSNGTVLFDKVNDINTTASIKQITNSDNKKQKVNKEIKKRV